MDTQEREKVFNDLSSAIIKVRNRNTSKLELQKYSFFLIMYKLSKEPLEEKLFNAFSPFFALSYGIASPLYLVALNTNKLEALTSNNQVCDSPYLGIVEEFFIRFPKLVNASLDELISISLGWESHSYFYRKARREGKSRAIIPPSALRQENIGPLEEYYG